MQVVTDFEATRKQVEMACKVFSRGYEEGLADLEAKRKEWVEKRLNKWRLFPSSRENLEISARHLIESYYHDYAGYSLLWWERKAGAAKALSKKFTYAINTLRAHSVTLDDDEVALLGITLASVLEN